MSNWTGLALAALVAGGLLAVPVYGESLPTPSQPGNLRVVH